MQQQKNNVHTTVHDGYENLKAQTSAQQVKGELEQMKRHVDGLSRKLSAILKKL